MSSKLKRIVLSRFSKDKNQDWIKVRRGICNKCIFNSKNTTKKPKLIVRVLISLSDFYSYITGNKKDDNLGNCTACSGCSVYYKTEEEYESCPKGKWDYILD